MCILADFYTFTQIYIFTLNLLLLFVDMKNLLYLCTKI